MPEYRNNHFVPRAYLRRFSPSPGSPQAAPFISQAAALAARSRDKSLRQIGLYHFASDKVVQRASIRDQCSDDYFYSKNPHFERMFSSLEASQQGLLNQILTNEQVPEHGFEPSQTVRSSDHVRLCNAIMFQSGRTASAAEQQTHIANQFGKMILKHHLEAEGNNDLLKLLPSVKIEKKDIVLDSIQESLTAAALILDMGIALFRNETDEDFVTSDHPIARSNSLPGLNAFDRRTGFASRGLVILYPLTPRHLLYLYDCETYQLKRASLSAIAITERKDVVELNLAQCRQAIRSLYFADEERVDLTLAALRERRGTLRPPPTQLSTEVVEGSERLSRIRYDYIPRVSHLRLPKPLSLRFAARSGRYQSGDERVRNFTLEVAARSELARVRALREKATETARSQRASEAKQ